MRKWFLIGCLCSLPLLKAAPANAGVLTTLGAKWQAFSFRALEAEDTPNYYGYGLLLNFGYSFAKVIDVAVYGSYVPSQLKAAKVAAKAMRYYEYGGELGVRVGQVVYLGFKYGLFNYQLEQQKLETEIPGNWSGPGGAVTVGGFWAVDKESYIQFGVEAGSAQLASADSADGRKRMIDTYGATMTYVFNATDTFKFLGGNHISDFLNSLSF